MSSKTKRSTFATFMNIAPTSTADYELMGDGITTGTINYNPNAVTEQYIHQDSGTTDIESYAPTMPVEATYRIGDDVLDFIEGLRKSRAVLADAQTDIVNVWLYETPTLGEYPAEKQSVSIQFDTFGGDAGTSNKINFTINYIGDPVLGTFNPTTKTFTPNP